MTSTQVNGFDAAPLRVHGIRKPGPHYGATSLRDLRIKAGMTGPELAEKAGVSKSTIYLTENGQANPDSHRRDYAKLAKALGASLEEFYKPSALPLAPPKEPKAAKTNLPAVVEPPEREAKPKPAKPPRTSKDQVQRIGIALTYDGEIIGGASLALDTKAMKPLFKKLLKEWLFADED